MRVDNELLVFDLTAGTTYVMKRRDQKRDTSLLGMCMRGSKSISFLSLESGIYPVQLLELLIYFYVIAI